MEDFIGTLTLHHLMFFFFAGGPFQLPENFFWNPWQKFHQPGQWKSGLIDSWVDMIEFIY